VPRVEEARGPALGRLAPVEARIGAGHPVAALLQRFRDRRHVLRPAGPVERLIRLVVALDRRLIVRPRLRRSAGRVDAFLELLDVVGQRDEVVLRRLADLREGLLLPPPPAAVVEQVDAAADRREDDDGRDTRAAGLVPAVGAAAVLPRVCHALDEVVEHRRSAVGTVGVERLSGQVTGDARLEEVAARTEVPPGDERVGPPPAEPVVELPHHAVGAAAGLGFERVPDDGDVDGAGACRADLVAELSSFRVGQRRRGAGVDADRIGAQAGDDLVDRPERVGAGNPDRQRERGDQADEGQAAG
jgi:hypothetical protein